MTEDIQLISLLLTPLVGMLLLALAGRWPNLREAITLITAVVLFSESIQLAVDVLGGARPGLTLIEMLPGLTLRLAVEPLGAVFSVISSGLWIISTLYSIGYMRGNKEKKQTRFFVCFAGAIFAAQGIALAGNMLTLFMFYEAMTLITYPLVTHHGTDHARNSARTYLGVLLGTSIAFLLSGLLATWVIAGTLDFRQGGILAGHLGATGTALLLVLYMFGIGKAALMPFHRWLPAAMVAPTPVSALLHAVAVVKAGVFTIVKVIVYIFGTDNLMSLGSADWVPVIAGFSILSASIVALRADNLKRRLAYSTVSQLSYVTLAATLLAPISIVGAVMHIAAHALGKITLFFAAGSIYTAAHKTEVSQLDGIGRRMPWTMVAFSIGALSMIGLPPAAGFVSKWYILSAAMSLEHWLAVGVLVLSTLLNAGYFLPIVWRAFFREPPSDADDHHDEPHAAHGEAPLLMVFAQTTTAAMTIGLFFYHEPVLRLARAVAGAF
ncbi:monovalent cation/H+ antiporter subunit D family protein [Denitromonas ohlonensis]|uniref:Monovalent cation/H+ antiporter subunit D family protein n=2 Tax=Denitromonas TaxID=139331 RepID=A0A557RC66_9RHOO|nr:monovalent cation/H+ antiporter subunit D family protein [Denitromonas ohlonensis]TVO62696.1 monovalent cation/H+ antiporter subunit D family protein [Denitromonas ohlonensis]TVO78900.1 monovalent cation/H+ antiporter subunit D family protein [Denitromonas ohlonensis]TVT75126.1 MAG: monovalent cation/H+ antiporter subunit D family protein [Denitromonas halophila]